MISSRRPALAAHASLTAEVKLDDKAPILTKPRYIDETQTNHKQHGRIWLTVPAADPASGVEYMQFAEGPDPWAWRSFVRTVSVRTKQNFIWVRTADAAGNVSPFGGSVRKGAKVMGKLL
jgi:hypothetical protein